MNAEILNSGKLKYGTFCLNTKILRMLKYLIITAKKIQKYFVIKILKILK